MCAAKGHCGKAQDWTETNQVIAGERSVAYHTPAFHCMITTLELLLSCPVRLVLFCSEILFRQEQTACYAYNQNDVQQKHLTVYYTVLNTKSCTPNLLMIYCFNHFTLLLQFYTANIVHLIKSCDFITSQKAFLILFWHWYTKQEQNVFDY